MVPEERKKAAGTKDGQASSGGVVRQGIDRKGRPAYKRERANKKTGYGCAEEEKREQALEQRLNMTPAPLCGAFLFVPSRQFAQPDNVTYFGSPTGSVERISRAAFAPG